MFKSRGKKIVGMCLAEQETSTSNITIQKKNPSKHTKIEPAKPYYPKSSEYINDLWTRSYSLTAPSIFRKFNEYETSNSESIDIALTRLAKENDDNFLQQSSAEVTEYVDCFCYEVMASESTNDDTSIKDFDSDDSVKDKDYVPDDDISQISSDSEKNENASIIYSFPSTVEIPESVEAGFIKESKITELTEIHTYNTAKQDFSPNFSVSLGQRIESLKSLCVSAINSYSFIISNKRSLEDDYFNLQKTDLEINKQNNDEVNYKEEMIVIVIEEEIDQEENILINKSEENNIVQDEGGASVEERNKEIEPEGLIDENSEESENEEDPGNSQLYTKLGLLRKRKIYETSLIQRKQAKRTKYREKFLVKGSCNCVKKCVEQFNEDRRKELNECYWNMSWKSQRMFIRQSCHVITPKRKITSSPKRHPKRTFFFKNRDENKIDMCKAFFLTTLGYKPTNDKVLYNALNVADCSDLEDKRGKHLKRSVFDRDIITQHIHSFNPTTSHYRREHAPLRRYLPSDVNVKMMHEDFLGKHPNQQLSYDLYRKHLKSMNISFARLGNEECEICESHDIHCKSESHDKENLPSDCQICNDYSDHKIRARKARILYTKHKDSKDDAHLYFSTDLEKIIMLPRLDTFKEVIFCPRLTAYNQTFAPLGKSHSEKPLAVLWHDAIAGRKQLDIISAFRVFFMKYRDVKNIDLWLDNCSAQNKNWLLFFYLVDLINSDKINSDTITLNYFEKGHTYMSCDHFHHQVELSMKKTGKIYDFQDFVDTVEKANSGKVSVKAMQITDFVDISDYTSNRRIQTSTPRVYMKNIVKVSFHRKSFNMFYKTDFDEDYIEVCFIKDTYLKRKNGSIPASVTTPRNTEKGITETRKANIVAKLGKLMPAHKLVFWKNLATNKNEETD